jgi:hypothetical protein
MKRPKVVLQVPVPSPGFAAAPPNFEIHGDGDRFWCRAMVENGALLWASSPERLEAVLRSLQSTPDEQLTPGVV